MAWTCDAQQAEAVLAQADIFRGAAVGDAAGLTEQLQLVEFPAGQTIYAAGELCDRVYVIASGKVKIALRSSDGRVKLLTLMGPPDMFGELSIFDLEPSMSSATAVTDVRVVSLQRDTLRSWIAERPEMAEQLLRVMARRPQHSHNSLADLFSADGPGRIAKQLLALAQRFGTHDGDALRVTRDLTQEEIAQLVGASRESVSKTFAEFTHRGWIRLEGRSVLIYEPERLARRAR